MTLSFTITRPAIALWWALLWRYLLWLLILLLPMALVSLIVSVGVGLLEGLIIQAVPASGTVLVLLNEVLKLLVRSFLIPIILYGFVFWRLFKKGRFGRYSISGSYHNESVTTLKPALNYAFWFYVEVLKYIWPWFFFGMVAGAGAVMLGKPVWGGLGIALLISFPLALYTHWLVLTDILKRRRFKHFTLEVDRRDA